MQPAIKKNKIELTQDRLKEVLHYDSETGIFTRILIKNQKRFLDKEAGYIKKNGYVQISIDNVDYTGHKLAWLYVYGVNPLLYIDHKDRVRSNNSIRNLRLLTPDENNKNKSVGVNNTSGVVGVYVRKERYCAYLGGTGYIGSSKDFEEAVAMRYCAEQCLDWEKYNKNSSAKLYMDNYLKKVKQST